MPNKVDADDWLYRMVKPEHYLNGDLLADAFDDKYPAQSFNVVRIASPRHVIEKFANRNAVRKRCNKVSGQPDPNYLEMYDSGYRVIAISARLLLKNGLLIETMANGDDYDDDGHVNVIDAKRKSVELALRSHTLNRNEMVSGFIPTANVVVLKL